MYRTRLLVYRSVKKIAASLANKDRNGDEAVSSLDEDEAMESLRALVPLLDGILISEYDPGYKTFPKSKQAHLPLCDFCGADIFQSFFECPSCLSVGVTPPGPYQMCAGCYVEGRRCACGGLEPRQRRSFKTLIRHRNQAAALIPEDVEVVTLTPESVLLHLHSEAPLIESCSHT